MPANQIVQIYKSNYADKVMRLAEPLKKAFGTDIFGYSRLQQDGSYFQITTKAQPSEFYFSNDLYLDNVMTRNPDLFVNGFSLLNMCDIGEEDPGQKKMNGKYNFDHFLFFVHKEQNDSHLFYFSAQERNPQLLNTFMNNLHVFRKYTQYFMNEWNSYLPNMDRYSINLKEQMGAKFDKVNHRLAFNPNIAEKELFLKKIGVLDIFPSQVLSRREVDCLNYLRIGYTARLTGKALCLSNRTVESYIASAKNKLGIFETSDLVKKFDEWKSYGLF